MRCTLALFVLFFLAGAFAEQAWKLSTFGAIDSKPVFFEDKMVVGSQDGTIDYVFWQTGNLMKKVDTGEGINSVKMGGGFVVAASSNSIFILDKIGNVVRDLNESMVYGIEAGQRIYATTGDGLKIIDYGGNPVWLVPMKGTLTEPTEYGDGAVFGADDRLVFVAANGTIRQTVRTGPMWKSKPMVYNNITYVGSTDGKMYAVGIYSGSVLWEFQTGGWVMGNALYDKGTVYFGSNDGYAYAVNADNGALKWKRKIPEAVQGAMEIVPMAGKDMVLTGSNYNRAYMLDAGSGEIALTFPANGWVHSPTLHSNMIFFGSYDGSVYAFIADRSCSIETPVQGDVVGYKAFNASGRLYSQYSGARVQLKINNASWNEARVSGNSWNMAVDPGIYDFGPLLLECRVVDTGGEERSSFTQVVVLRDINAQKDILRSDVPSSVTAGKAFQVKAYESDGTPMDGFQVVVGGKTFQGKNGSATVSVENAGTYNMLVRKTGYEDSKAVLSVGLDMLMIGVGAATVLAVAGAAYYLFIYRK